MANRRFTSQFSYSFERQPVSLMGSFTQSGSTGTFATLVNNGITWTAVTMGTGGNSITVALVAGGTAGAEVVSVSGNAISVQIESTVSTRTQVLTAVQASAAASALVGISVASGGTAATLLAATHLATGTSTAFTTVANGITLSQIGTGVFQLNIPDPYAALLSFDVMILSASAADLKPQLKSVSLSSLSGGNAIVFRTIAGSTNTNLSSGQGLYIKAILRNSAQSSS